MQSRRPFEWRASNAWTVAWVALVVAWAILSWPWLSGHYTIPWDAKAEFLPQVQFLAASLASGESPFWTPFEFSGHPQIADPQSMMFSPPHLMLAALDATPTAWAFDATLFVMILIAAAATMLWLRDRRWHPAAAVVTALSFAFGAAMAWRIQHAGQVLSLCYLPITLLFLDRALDRRSVVYGVLAGLAASALVLGRDQVGLLAIYFLVGYVISKLAVAPDRAGWIRRAWPPLSAAAVTGAAVIAVPIILTALLAKISNRPAIDFVGAGRGSLHPALFLSAFSANAFNVTGPANFWGPPSATWTGTGLYIAQNMGVVYFGALPLAGLLVGTVTGVFAHRDIRYIVIALAVAVIYALGWYTPIFAFMHAHVPGVDLYRRPADAVFMIGFLASLLSGYALNRLLSEPSPGISRRQWGIALLTAAAGFATLFALAVHFGKLASAGPIIAGSAAVFTASALCLMHESRQRLSGILAVALFAALLTADLSWSNGPGDGGATAQPPAGFDVLDPSTKNDTIAALKTLTTASRGPMRRDRVELVGFGFHWPNASLTHGLENTLGYNPVRLQSYTQATGAEDHAGLPEQRRFSPLFPSYRSTLADLLGLRYIATSVPIEQIDKKLRSGDLNQIAKTSEGYIYENPRALPRVLFANAAVRGDFASITASGRWPDVDLKTTVILEEAAASAAKRPGEARIASYHNTAITIETDSPDGGWVVLNDIWHPWWFASVDGAAVLVLKANVLFRTVEVGPGKHTIVFSFRPIKGALRELGLQ